MTFFAKTITVWFCKHAPRRFLYAYFASGVSNVGFPPRFYTESSPLVLKLNFSLKAVSTWCFVLGQSRSRHGPWLINFYNLDAYIYN